MISAECDEVAAARLKALLAQMGYEHIATDVDDPVVRDLMTWTFSGPDGVLVVEAETYIGLSVTGSSLMIERLKGAFAEPDR